ncbi:hypothetical protein L7F22_030706 [Adiantum nelumboides]|nr:hypothetical protein [Adiantum nelumboides]
MEGVLAQSAGTLQTTFIHGRVHRNQTINTWTSKFNSCSFLRQIGVIGKYQGLLIGPVCHKSEFSPARTVHVCGAFTETQEALVKDTWAVLKKDAGHHAMVLFNKVFEVAPSAKKLFSFLKDSDVPVEQNAKLKSHALKVFVIICEAATSLRQKGEVSTPGSTMKDMAHSHNMSGVVDEHYEVVKYCMLKTLEEGLPADKVE